MYRGKSLQQGTISAERSTIRIVRAKLTVAQKSARFYLNSNAHINIILLRVISFEYRVSP